MISFLVKNTEFLKTNTKQNILKYYEPIQIIIISLEFNPINIYFLPKSNRPGSGYRSKNDFR